MNLSKGFRDGTLLAGILDDALSRWVYDIRVSPTIFQEGGYRFSFFSREERRMHIHVHHGNGEAKFWLEPEIELAVNYGLNSRRLSVALDLIRRHEDEIRTAWKAYFRG